MEPDRALAISALEALIALSEAEEEKLHAILDDDGEDAETREAALRDLARVLRNHHTQLDQLAELEVAL
jgi:hypothetical protein